MLDWINTNRACHIVTIEDPIEYVHHNKRATVDQREVGIDTLSFDRRLRAAFREDPDVLLIGEIRDNETIRAALTLAETGHLVFATLHTNDAAQTVDRIVDVFPAERRSRFACNSRAHSRRSCRSDSLPRIGGGMVAAFEVLVATYATRNIVRDGRSNQLRNVIMTGAQDGMQTLEGTRSQTWFFASGSS